MTTDGLWGFRQDTSAGDGELRRLCHTAPLPSLNWTSARESEIWGAPHLENCRSLASMLLCLMHILVRAEPISLVPPEKQERQS